MERVGPYEVHEQLGRGGMGAVYRAVDGRSGQEVALKVLTVTEERARRRLVLEALALTRLRHRNVVSLLEAGEDRGRPWIALELVRGRSLQERLDKEGPLAPRDAARLVQALAVGLAHAHREGVLHRDLKPANVLVPDGDGEPRLTDFGLAGFTFDLSQSRLTTSGMIMGSPGYWAPEQASGQASALGPQTDVYGLGAVLYAVLTGRPPIEGESLPDILMATERQRPEPPRKDRVLDAVALRCLEKVPADRYGSVDEVARELSRYLSGRTARRGDRRRAMFGGAAIALVVMLGAGAWIVSARSRTSSPEPTPEPTPQAKARGLVTRAAARAAGGDTQGALADLDRAIALDPLSSLAYSNRAALKERVEDFEGAVADCDRAIELDPMNAFAYMNRGAVKTILGQSGAGADLDRAIELDPRNPHPYTFRGRHKINAGAPQDAIADLDQAIELDPGHKLAHEYRANARTRVGDHEGALADCERVVELAPGSAYAYQQRGMARLRLHDHPGAIADFDRALELDPRDASAYAHRGFARSALGDDASAIPDYEQGLALQPGASWADPARQWLADARARLSAREVAAAELQTLRASAAARFERGDFKGAVADDDRAIELDPRSTDAYIHRAAAKEALREFQQAVVDLDRAIELDPRNGLAYHRRANVRLEINDRESALADADRAVELTSTSRAFELRARARLRFTDYQGALADLDRAIELDPGHARDYAYRGYAKLGLGDNAGAIVDLEEALRRGLDERWERDARHWLEGARTRAAGKAFPE